MLFNQSAVAQQETLTLAQADTSFKLSKLNSGLMPEPHKFAALVVDASSGKVLFHKNAGEKRYPASLTKMMTVYLLFDALKRKKIRMNTYLPVSSRAAAEPPTNIFLKKGDRVSVETAIKALIVRSANDVSMVVAEALGGSKEGFARLMNRKARELGMNDTNFVNPHGLPDRRQTSNAYDMARIAIALRRDFPEYYHYFKTKSFKYRSKTYTGHNRVVGKFPGADGVKTGYINDSGFNLVTSVKRGDNNLVAVVMGGKTASSRDQIMMDLLNQTITRMAGTGNRASSYAAQ